MSLNYFQHRVHTDNRQKVEFTYTYQDKEVKIKSESVILSELLEDFRSFCLAIGHSEKLVRSIDFVVEEK